MKRIQKKRINKYKIEDKDLELMGAKNKENRNESREDEEKKL